jgi:putative endonuclease
MTRTRLALGRSAEQTAARLLEERGAAIIARNERVRYRELGIAGELDLVALDGDCLVFVEVKAARAGATRGPERPVLAVTPRKQLRLRRLARAWMTTASVPRHFSQIRFDVVGVTVDAANRITDIEHIRSAF